MKKYMKYIMKKYMKRFSCKDKAGFHYVPNRVTP